MILRVLAENVTPVWPQVSELLAPAVAMRPTHDMEDVRLSLLGGNSQLWIQWTGPGEPVEAALVSELAAYPRGVWVRIWLDGAHRGRSQDDAGFLAALTAFRAQVGARGFEAVGRSGWVRRFPQVTVEGLVMRWTMED